MTLNDECFVECADALARRMEASDDTLRVQLKNGYLWTTCHEPNESDLDDLEAFVEKLPSNHDAHARLKFVASVLLNLDEVITK